MIKACLENRVERRDICNHKLQHPSIVVSSPKSELNQESTGKDYGGLYMAQSSCFIRSSSSWVGHLWCSCFEAKESSLQGGMANSISVPSCSHCCSSCCPYHKASPHFRRPFDYWDSCFLWNVSEPLSALNKFLFQ